MGLLAIMAGLEEPPVGAKGLNPHDIASVLGELLRGRYTAQELIAKMGLSAGTLVDEMVDWAQPFNGLAPESDIHGSLFTVNASATQALQANTWAKVTLFTTVGVSQRCTPSAANDEIEVTYPGVYKVSYACTFTAPALAQVGFRVQYNGSAQNQTLSSTGALSLGLVGFLSGSGFVDVTSKANTPFLLQVQSTVAGNFTLIHGQFVLERVRPAPGRVDPSGNPVNRQKIHDVMNGLQQGIYTVEEAELELDYTTI